MRKDKFDNSSCMASFSLLLGQYFWSSFYSLGIYLITIRCCRHWIWNYFATLLPLKHESNFQVVSNFGNFGKLYPTLRPFEKFYVPLANFEGINSGERHKKQQNWRRGILRNGIWSLRTVLMNEKSMLNKGCTNCLWHLRSPRSILASNHSNKNALKRSSDQRK